MRRFLIVCCALAMLSAVTPASAAALVASHTTTPSAPYGVAAGDVDGNGKGDVVVSYQPTGSLQTFFGNGDGTFVAGPTTPSVAPTAGEIILADVNGDSFLDVAGSFGGSPSPFGMFLRLGNGTGTFNATVPGSPVVFGSINGETDLAAADLNLDGRLDFVLTTQGFASAYILTWNGSSLMYVTSLGLTGLAWDVAVGRLDADPFPDIVIAQGSSNQVQIIRQFAPFGFSAAGGVLSTSPTSVTIADVDGASGLDLVTGSFVAGGMFTARYHLGNNAFGFGAATTIASGSGTFGGSEVAVADISGDGRNDVVLANPSNPSIVYAERNGSSFTATTYAARPGPTKIALGRIDGDAVPDIVVSDATAPAFSVFLRATPPSAPVSPAAARGLNSATVSWSAPTSNGGAPISAYRVYAGAASGALGLVASVSAGTFSYTETGLADGQLRFYAVSAVNAAGEGPRSAEVSARAFDVPSPPVVVAQPGAAIGEVAVSWSAPSDDGGTPVSAYRLCRGTTSGTYPLCADLGTAQTFTDTGAALATTYYYVVTAENLAGVGARSAEACSKPFPWVSALGC